MHSFHYFLEELSHRTGITFSIVSEDGNDIYSEGSARDKSNDVSFRVMLGRSKALVSLPRQYEICAPLLKYTIEEKYGEFYTVRDQYLIDLLEGKQISSDKIERSIPFLKKGCTLFVVDVEGSHPEALNIIHQLYSEQEAISILYKDLLIILGVFEDIYDHALSIRESIVSDLYSNSSIGYGSVFTEAQDIRKAFEDGKDALFLKRNFGLKEEIIDYSKVQLEKVVYSVKSDIKDTLQMKLSGKLNTYDAEIITTIEEFINSGLNISDAAKKLYVHRNTLVYRLDKIHKDTGFDIRDFKEATVFIIAFLVWKEHNNKA